MHDFRKLEIWHEAVDLAVAVYELTEQLPGTERFGLVSQMRRSAVSVSSNIAEGAGRGTELELKRFLRIANGSLSEVDSQLELSVRLEFLDPETGLTAEIHRLRNRINALHDSLS